MKKKLILLILLLTISIGVTYAIFKWTSSNFDVTFEVESCYKLMMLVLTLVEHPLVLLYPKMIPLMSYPKKYPVQAQKLTLTSYQLISINKVSIKEKKNYFLFFYAII